MADELRKRLDVTSLRPKDIELTFGDDRPGAEPGAKITYSIRGDLPIKTMIRLLTIERRMRELTGDDPLVLLESVQEANDAIVTLIAERYDDPWIPELSVPEATQILAWVATGGEVGSDEEGEPLPLPTVEETVRRDITAGAPAGDDDEDGAAIEREAAAGVGATDDDPPLTSTKPSPGSSSTSGSSTSGSSAGGSETEPHGPPSDSTSLQQIAS